jgi:CHRD domain
LVGCVSVVWLTYNRGAMRIPRVLAAVVLVSVTAVAVTSAQASRTFKTRLGTVPVEAATLSSLIGGSGAVTAVLTGNRLNVSGTFKGLHSPATVARLHVAPKGQRGPAMLDIPVTKAASGTISGELTLTPIQVDHLVRNRVYVQLYSEKAPEGVLWGWLLP